MYLTIMASQVATIFFHFAVTNKCSIQYVKIYLKATFFRVSCATARTAIHRTLMKTTSI